MRNDLFLRALAAANGLHACQDIANQWRTMTGQAIRNPTPNPELARESTAVFGPAAVQDVLQMANDAANLLREAQGACAGTK